jgi:hypothetical protein
MTAENAISAGTSSKKPVRRSWAFKPGVRNLWRITGMKRAMLNAQSGLMPAL